MSADSINFFTAKFVKKGFFDKDSEVKAFRGINTGGVSCMRIQFAICVLLIKMNNALIAKSCRIQNIKAKLYKR